MNDRPDDRSSILKATAAAFTIAGALLITMVLPAEYGIDPIGTGRLLGLTGLSTGEAVTLRDESRPFKTDEITFTLGTFESVEYKYELASGSSLTFSWQASAPITFDLHGEPLDGPEGFAESFKQGKEARNDGTFVAPFAGRHGWFFENRSFAPVDVKLRVAGFFSKKLVYRDGFVDSTGVD